MPLVGGFAISSEGYFFLLQNKQCADKNKADGRPLMEYSWTVWSNYLQWFSNESHFFYFFPTSCHINHVL